MRHCLIFNLYPLPRAASPLFGPSARKKPSSAPTNSRYLPFFPSLPPSLPPFLPTSNPPPFFQVDQNVRAYISLKAADRWLSVRLELLGACVVALGAVLAVQGAAVGKLGENPSPLLILLLFPISLLFLPFLSYLPSVRLSLLPPFFPPSFDGPSTMQSNTPST